VFPTVFRRVAGRKLQSEDAGKAGRSLASPHPGRT